MFIIQIRKKTSNCRRLKSDNFEYIKVFTWQKMTKIHYPLNGCGDTIRTPAAQQCLRQEVEFKASLGHTTFKQKA